MNLYRIDTNGRSLVIFMSLTFSSNARVLVNEHALDHSWFLEIQFSADGLHAVAERVASEDRMQEVERVANLQKKKS